MTLSLLFDNSRKLYLQSLSRCILFFWSFLFLNKSFPVILNVLFLSTYFHIFVMVMSTLQSENINLNRFKVALNGTHVCFIYFPELEELIYK